MAELVRMSIYVLGANIHAYVLSVVTYKAIRVMGFFLFLLDDAYIYKHFGEWVRYEIL